MKKLHQILGQENISLRKTTPQKDIKLGAFLTRQFRVQIVLFKYQREECVPFCCLKERTGVNKMRIVCNNYLALSQTSFIFIVS